MKMYTIAAIAGLYMMSFSPIDGGIRSKEDKVSKGNEKNVSNVSNISPPKSYTMIVDIGDWNPTEGIGVGVIHNNDTTKTSTDYSGRARFQARPNDKVYFYPTQKSGPFKSLDVVLNDTTFNMIRLEPENFTPNASDTASMYKDASLMYNNNSLEQQDTTYFK